MRRYIFVAPARATSPQSAAEKFATEQAAAAEAARAAVSGWSVIALAVPIPVSRYRCSSFNMPAGQL